MNGLYLLVALGASERKDYFHLVGVF